METIYETKQQLAVRLGVSRRTINHWMAQRRIPFYRISERVVRFVPAEIDAKILQLQIRSGVPKLSRA